MHRVKESNHPGPHLVPVGRLDKLSSSLSYLYMCSDRNLVIGSSRVNRKN